MKRCVVGIRQPEGSSLQETETASIWFSSLASLAAVLSDGPTKDVRFFEHPYPEGYKSYSRSKRLTTKEFDHEKVWWGGPQRMGRKTTEHVWKVSAKDIAVRNYSLDCKNPHEVAVELGDPDELMAEYQQITKQLADAQHALKTELLAALKSTSGGPV